MTINRSALRRNSAQDLLKKIQEAGSKKDEGGSGGKDDRFWQPTVDSNGNGFAVIRFLPSKTEESLPWVKTYNHGFKIGNRWFIEDCPTTVGKECPVCKANSDLWNSGFEANKKIASGRKRKLRYVSAVLVIKDPKNPEAEGKIALFSYGQKIFEKLMTASNPPEEYGEKPIDPFAFFDGGILRLKIKQKDGFRNYDDSVVEAATDLYDGDEEKLMAVLEQIADIQEFMDEKRFKSYEALETAFNRILGTEKKDEDSVADEPKSKATSGTEYGDSVKTEKVESDKIGSSDDDDADLAFFRQMADS